MVFNSSPPAFTLSLLHAFKRKSFYSKSTQCYSKSTKCYSRSTQRIVKSTHIYSKSTQCRVKTRHIYSKSTQGCVKSTHIYSKSTQGCVKSTHIYSKSTKYYIKSTQFYSRSKRFGSSIVPSWEECLYKVCYTSYAWLSTAQFYTFSNRILGKTFRILDLWIFFMKMLLLLISKL